jgi:hypothetical protein
MPVNTKLPSLANFVGGACPANARVVGFLGVSVIRRMPARRMPGSLLLAEADPLNATGHKCVMLIPHALTSGGG